MPTLKEKIQQDLKEALRARNTVSVSAQRMLLAEIHNREIEKREPLTDEEIFAVLSRVAKKHEDSIAQFQTGGRQDLVTKEEAELAIVRSYLPKPLSEEELKILVQQAITDLGAVGPQDFGRVMQQVMALTKGRASGALVSELVKEELNKHES